MKTEIQVTINGFSHTLTEPLSVRQAVLQFAHQYDHTAVWINGKSVLLAEYDSRMLEYGDEMQIIYICGGG